MGAVVWGLLTSVPWLVAALLLLAMLGVAAWIHAQTMRQTKPGDDARVRFLGVLRIDLRRGLPSAEREHEKINPPEDRPEDRSASP
jgi:type IV secretory pathway TrbD component